MSDTRYEFSGDDLYAALARSGLHQREREAVYNFLLSDAAHKLRKAVISSSAVASSGPDSQCPTLGG